MSIDELKKRVEDLEEQQSKSWDPEHFHSLEDAIWQNTLEAIADGAPNAQALAKVALQTTELDFERWYA